MNIANQVKSLTEDIEASYGTRIAAVSDIVKETRQTLGNFNREHEKMAGDLKRSLASSESVRKDEAGELMKEIRGFIRVIEEESRERVDKVKDLLKSFAQKHQEMANDLLSFLSSSEKERIEEFTTLIGEIKGAVTAIEKDTAETLADFRSSHREMSQAQKVELVKVTKERIEEVSKKLSEFGRGHQEMARQLRGELSSFQKKLERIVKEMRTPVIADLKEAKRNWQNLAKVMAAKRAGKSIPAPRAEMGVPTAVKEAAEEAFEEGEIKDRVLRVIQANPNGIKLADIGKALNIAFIRAAKPVKDLLSEVRITKRDSEYLPS